MQDRGIFHGSPQFIRFYRKSLVDGNLYPHPCPMEEKGDKVPFRLWGKVRLGSTP